jgi:predicted peroxiredoxin
VSFIDDAADGVAILLWAADPAVPQRLATPFFHAAAAAALEVPVEVYFTARSVQLLVPGVAEHLHASERIDTSILDAMRAAVEHGARFLACTDALHGQGIDPHALIPECAGHGGALQFMSRAASLRWRTLVY